MPWTITHPGEAYDVRDQQKHSCRSALCGDQRATVWD